MKKFAQVFNGKLHWMFEQDDAPDFSADIQIVEITGITPAPQCGWDWDGEHFVPPPVASPEESLALAKTAALLSIDQYHSDTIQRLVGNPTQVEKDTWSLKLETANSIAGKTPVSAAGQAFLVNAGMTTDATKEAWALAVLAKSAAYAGIVGLAEKQRDAARSAVKSAADESSLITALDEQRRTPK